MRKDLVKIIKHCESEIKKNDHLRKAIQFAPDSLRTGYIARVEAYQEVIDKINEYNPGRK